MTPKDSHSYSDGVVCADSAQYSSFNPLVTPYDGGPTIPLSDPTIVHTNNPALILGEFLYFALSLQLRSNSSIPPRAEPYTHESCR
jgi:hypothetical protein